MYHDARSPERQRQYLHRKGFFFVMVTQCVYCEMCFSVTNSNIEPNKKSRYNHAPTIKAGHDCTVLGVRGHHVFSAADGQYDRNM